MNQDGRLACVRETVEGDGDETTDSNGDDGMKDAIKELERLASECNRTVRELRTESKGKAFDISRLVVWKWFPQTPDSDNSEGDESESTVDCCQGTEERRSSERTGLYYFCSIGTRRTCERWTCRMDEFQIQGFRRIQESACKFLV